MSLLVSRCHINARVRARCDVTNSFATIDSYSPPHATTQQSTFDRWWPWQIIWQMTTVKCWWKKVRFLWMTCRTPPNLLRHVHGPTRTASSLRINLGVVCMCCCFAAISGSNSGVTLRWSHAVHGAADDTGGNFQRWRSRSTPRIEHWWQRWPMAFLHKIAVSLRRVRMEGSSCWGHLLIRSASAVARGWVLFQMFYTLWNGTLFDK